MPVNTTSLYAGGRSKKSKKRAKYLARQAEVELFRPLCDLVEDRLSLEVGQLELSSQAEVPPLVELCVRKIRKTDLGGCPGACRLVCVSVS